MFVCDLCRNSALILRADGDRLEASLNPVRTLQVTLTDAQRLGPITVGVGYPTDRHRW